MNRNTESPLRNPEPAPSEAEESEVESIAEILKGPLDTKSLPLMALMVLAGLYTLYFAKPFLLPIVLSILLTLLLRPIVAGLARARIPEPAGAALVVLVLIGGAVGTVYGLSAPAANWIRDAPGMLTRVEAKIRPLLRPMKQVNEATAQVEKKISGSSEEGTETVAIKQAGFSSTIFLGVGNFVAAATVVLILLYFLLASGDMFLRKLVNVLPNFHEKKRAVEIAAEIRQGVSTYLLTVSLIYLGLGVCVALAMWLLGMPNPVLWGVMASLLNFIPYLGALTTCIVLSIAAVLTFDSVAHAVLVPAVFLSITTVEGYFVTPLVLGRQLTLNPVIIFLGMTFWWWLWGIPGALLAVPLLAILKIVCERIEPLKPIGEFMGN